MSNLDVEDLSDEELYSRFVFLKGRITNGKFVSEASREQTYEEWSDVEYETKRRELL